MKLVGQLLTAGILVWEGKFTLSEEPSVFIFRKKKVQVEMLTVFSEVRIKRENTKQI